MSSISFPPSSSFIAHPSASIQDPDELPYPNSFAASSSFQMNPLSAHPPRTPRSSIISNRSITSYGTDMYSSKSEAQTEQHDVESVVEEPQATKQTRRIRPEAVWKELLKTSNGRDKAFKLIQYSIRMYLLFHTTLAATALLRKPANRRWEAELVKRLESTAAGFSLTRKCLILFNWVHPYHAIMAQHHTVSGDIFGKPSKPSAPKPLLHTFLHAPPPVLLELLNALADDGATFAKLGLLGKRTGERVGRVADWCWFLSTLVNLVENSVERSLIIGQQHQVESRLYAESMTGTTAKSIPLAKHDDTELQRLQDKDFWLKISRAKLFMDLVFVSYDVFRFKKAKKPVQTCAGLTAAVLSTLKLYNTHTLDLLKTSSA